jgi:hypothetical protein
MLKFIRENIRGVLSFFLWVNLISFVIAGWNTAEAIYIFSDVSHPLLGAIIGFFFGAFINVCVGGFFVTILNY